eukprot:CAMPEP_0118866224 /NCGR_PEP_ID=MMETSP1163-20130328/10212_1 /TAXON_ID=124430 /ORGANISM="Phaeomonas parva, Strain CCMP2877" /LENGTH=294 /DNA_ID=CAMNT_0006800523 /DNA_START=806 /DNA_END=1694 /DNA_ORIENTATION=+
MFLAGVADGVVAHAVVHEGHIRRLVAAEAGLDHAAAGIVVEALLDGAAHDAHPTALAGVVVDLGDLPRAPAEQQQDEGVVVRGHEVARVRLVLVEEREALVLGLRQLRAHHRALRLHLPHERHVVAQRLRDLRHELIHGVDVAHAEAAELARVQARPGVRRLRGEAPPLQVLVGAAGAEMACALRPLPRLALALSGSDCMRSAPRAGAARGSRVSTKPSQQPHVAASSAATLSARPRRHAVISGVGCIASVESSPARVAVRWKLTAGGWGGVGVRRANAEARRRHVKKRAVSLA